MKRFLSLLLAMIVVFGTLFSVTATVYADYDDNLIAHKKADKILQDYVDPNYHLKQDEYTFTKSEKKELKAVAKKAISGCKTQYQKIAAVTKYVAENIYYDFDYYEGRSSQLYTDPYDVWKKKRTVCAGYAALTQVLLQYLDIPCAFVYADNHGYNVAYDSQKDRWIYLDSTWCSGNVYGYGKFNKGSYYDYYFDMSLETLSRLSNHEFYGIDGIVIKGIEYSLDYDWNTVWSDYSKWEITVEGLGRSNTKATKAEIKGSIQGVPIKSIDANAFKGCTTLKTVKIGKGIKTIENSAFYGCKNLTSITLPDGLKTINYDAFYECEKLKSITIPSSVRTLGQSAFYKCKSIKTIKIPKGVKSIDYGTFKGCVGLESITIPSTVTSIGDSAFYKCRKLSSVTIPAAVTSIGTSAFGHCESLGSIKIPDKVKSIEGEAFGNCTGLKSVTIGKGIKSMGFYVFNQCEKLESVYISDVAAWCNIDFSYSSNPLTYAKKLYVNGKLTKNLVIPKGVKTIKDYAFNGFKNLESVQFPDTLKSIGGFAFEGCEKLSSVTIPKSVEKIGENAFSDCNNIGSVNITDIGAWSSIDFGNQFANPLSYANALYLNGGLITDVVVPDGVTKIGDYAFCGYNKLASITLPDTLKSIGDYSFVFCEGLTSIVVPDSVISIGDVAFGDCIKLESITIPDSVITIGADAFSFTAFYYYAPWESYQGTEMSYLYIGNHLVGVKNTSGGNFVVNPGTKSIAGGAFFNAQLDSVKIPDGVRGIGSCAFNCSTIKSVTIPSSVERIGIRAFSLCGNLTDVHYAGSEVQWSKIKIGKYNDELTKAKIHYGATDKPIAPKLKSISNINGGVKLNWKAGVGADSYRVYRKTSKGDWKYLDSTSKTSYTDKTAKSGTKYYYAVKSRNEAGNSSLSGSLSKYYLAAPAIKSFSCSADGVNIKWSKVSGAQGYIVYREVYDGYYEEISREKGASNTSFNDRGPVEGYKYTYKVKAYYSKTYSGYSKAKSVTFKY